MPVAERDAETKTARSVVPRVIGIAGGTFLAYTGVRLLYESLFRTDSSKPSNREERALLAGALHDIGPDGKFTLPAPLRARLHNARSIDDRIRLMRGLIRRSGLDPRLHMLAGRILSRRCTNGWCVGEKQWNQEPVALFNWVRKHVRYMRDPLRADAFKSARRTIEMGAGDCDDSAIVLGALLEAAGYPVGLRVVQTEGSKSWNHVYNLVGLPPHDPKRWVPLDASMNKPAGWEVPNATQAELTGRPVGMVIRSRSFRV